jgi:hypothetical protein
MNRIVIVLSISLILLVCHTAPAGSQPPMLGIYFDPDGGSMYGWPEPYPNFFDLYLLLSNADYYVTGVEFMLDLYDPYCILLDYTLPEGALEIGYPQGGMSIVYWPPLDGFSNDHLLMCTMHCITFESCFCHGGTLWDTPLRVLPHPDTGEIRGTYAWDNELFSIIGLTSYLCPYVWAPYIINVIVENYDEIRVVFDADIRDYSAETESLYTVIEHSSPPETLAVVSAMRHTSNSTVLTLERWMIDGKTYTVYANDICNASTYICGDSQFDFVFDSAIGTLLRSFSAVPSGTDIVISWLMAEIDDGIDFRVLRAEDGQGSFAALPPPTIERNGLEFRFTDRSVEPGKTYRYRVDYVEAGIIHLLFETEPVVIPGLPLTLYQNVPNPFNPVTAIRYYLPGPCRVTLDIFDAGGKRITRLVDWMEGPGHHAITWNGLDDTGSAVSSGLYLYRLTAGKETVARKMVLLK